jgi:hypothetical protein
MAKGDELMGHQFQKPNREQQNQGQKPAQREQQPGADQAAKDKANANPLPNRPDTQNRDLNDQERENEEENSNNR